MTRERYRKYKKLIVILLLLAIPSVWYFMGHFFFVSHASGRVLNAKGEPVSGAVVFAVRQFRELQKWRFHGSYRENRCVIVDSVIAGRNGDFSFPARLASKRRGWRLEADSLVLYTFAADHAPGVLGRFESRGLFEQPVRRDLGKRVDIEISMKPVPGRLFAHPEFVAALTECASVNANLEPALPGFAEVFRNADLASEEVFFRQWLNETGRIAMNVRFPDLMAEIDGAMTNEQIREFLVGDVSSAVQQVRLRKAIVDNDLDALHDLLADGANPNVDDGFRRSRLWLALDKGSLDAYLLLKKHGAVWRDDESEVMLHRLTARKNEKAALQLVADGTQAAYPSEGLPEAAILVAVRNGFTELVEAMLNASATVDKTTLSVALQEALRFKHLDMFQLLLAHGADGSGLDDDSTLLSGVVGKPEYAFAMLDQRVLPRVASSGMPLLTMAISRNQRQLADAMLNAGFSKVKSERFTAPLAAAASKGWTDMMAVMLNEPESAPGSHAWWQALSRTSNRNRDAFDLLLSEYSGDLGNPPVAYSCLLCRAAVSGHADIVGVLIERGAPVNGQSRLGVTALEQASDGGEAGNRLRQRGQSYDPNPVPRPTAMPRVNAATTPVRDLDDRPSHEAPFGGINVRASSNVNIGTAAHSAPGYSRPAHGHPAIVRLLLEAGANPNIQDVRGWTPLMRAAMNNEIEIMRLLLAAGADRQLKDIDGNTALQLAKDARHEEAVTLLSRDRK